MLTNKVIILYVGSWLVTGLHFNIWGFMHKKKNKFTVISSFTARALMRENSILLLNQKVYHDIQRFYRLPYFWYLQLLNILFSNCIHLYNFCECNLIFLYCTIKPIGMITIKDLLYQHAYKHGLFAVNCFLTGTPHTVSTNESFKGNLQCFSCFQINKTALDFLDSNLCIL